MVQDQARAIEEIYKQNPKLQGRVEILRLAWRKSLLLSGRRVGPLHISVAEPEQANFLIESGLVWDCQLHDCEPFSGDCQVTQCYRCFSYGHVAKACRNTPRCGYCSASGHSTDDCLGKQDPLRHRCVPCMGAHPSWSQECVERSKQRAKARMTCNSRPTRFYEPQERPIRPPLGESPIPTSIPSRPEGLHSTPPATAGPATTQGLPTTGPKQTQWQKVGPKKRGRPIGTTKAAKNARDIRNYIPPATSEQSNH
jgi:hypothetical protein